MHNLLEQTLTQTIERSCRPISNAGGRLFLNFPEFISSFKRSWIYGGEVKHPIDYDRFSGSLFLLLHKNVSVTNISCAEVLALFRTHTFARTPDNQGTPTEIPASISFFSDEEYTKFVSALLESLVRPFLDEHARIDRGAVAEFIKLVCDNYGVLLERTVIANFYYTSVLLHIPLSMYAKVRNIIAESGYIHSGGTAIYTRKADKAKMVELEDNLGSFLSEYSDKDVYLTPYAEEFFSPYDGNSVASLRQGLDGVKLILRKHFIEGKPLVEYLATLPSRFPLYVPLGIQDYATERKRVRTTTETKGTIWFISDHSIFASNNYDQSSSIKAGARVVKSSENPFLFVYEQAFINENQFVTFKERKPGWYASITLPHTLSIALTNITRTADASSAEDQSRLIVLDPFFGTGTTLFDAALRFKDAVIIGFDRDPMAAIAALDNAHFFGLGADSLRQKIELVRAGLSLLDKAKNFEDLRESVAQATSQQSRPPSHTAIFANALSILDTHIIKPSQLTQTPLSLAIKKTVFSPELDKGAFIGNDGAFDTRLLLYVMWRALSLGTFSIRDSVENVLLVLRKELCRTLKEIEHLKDRVTLNPTERIDGFCQSTGLYSHSLYVAPESMENIYHSIKTLTVEQMEEKGDVASWEPGVWLIQVKDSIDALTLVKGKVDILLTDPPYGFNAEEEGEHALMKSFGKLSDLLVQALRPGGQIAMVLPAFAKNGRQIPFYETGGTITRQLIAAGQRAGKGFVTQADTVPKPKELFSRPYYWVSTTVLERRILHFSLSN
jgi:hypothetical protein